MNINSVFKKSFYKESLVIIKKNGSIPQQWSDNSLTIINDTNDETDIGVVCNDQYIKHSNQPFNSTQDIYDSSIILSLYTSSQQRSREAFYRLDPVRISTANDKEFLSSFLFRTLFKYDSNGLLTPDLALDYGIHNNLFTEWTFEIKKKCHYENGDQILPSHIAYGISRRFAVDDIDDLQNESLYYPIFNLDIKTDNNGILYKGPYDRSVGYKKRQEMFNNAVIYNDNKMTITYKLNKTVYDFRDMLTWFCLSTPVPIDSCLPDGSDIDFKPISSGPYKINSQLSISYKSEDYDIFSTNDIKQKPRRYIKLILDRNDYWRFSNDKVREGKNYQNIIEVNFNQNPLTLQNIIINDLNKNAIILDNIPQSIFTLNGIPKLEYTDRALNFSNGFVNYLGINSQLINSKEIRQAFYYITDPTTFINAFATERNISISSLYASQADQILPPNQYDYTITPTLIRPNILQAKRLMNIAKTKNPINYNYVTSPSGITLTLPMLTNVERGFIQSWINNFAEIEITLNIIFVEDYYNELLNREKVENLSDLTYFTWCSDINNSNNIIRPILINDDTSPIHLMVNQYDTNYINFLTLLNNSQLILTLAEKNNQIHVIKQKIMDNMWVIPISSNNSQIAFGSKVRGVKLKYQTIDYGDIYLIK